MLLLDRLPLQVRRRRWACLVWLCCRLRVRRRGRRCLLTDSLAIVVSDHHDDELGLLGSDDLAHHLRPFAIAALIVPDETRIGAMFAHDADVGFLRKGILKPVGKPIRVRIAHHHNLDRSLSLDRRAPDALGLSASLRKRTGANPLDMSALCRLCCKSIFGIWSRNIDSRSDTNEQQRFKKNRRSDSIV